MQPIESQPFLAVCRWMCYAVARQAKRDFCARANRPFETGGITCRRQSSGIESVETISLSSGSMMLQHAKLAVHAHCRPTCSFFYGPACQADQQSTSDDSSASVTTVEADDKPAGVAPRVSDPVLQSLLDGTFAKRRAAESEDSGEEEEPKAVRKPKRNRPKKLVPQEKAVATAWGWDGKTGRDIGALEKWLRGRGLPAQKVDLQLVKEGGRGLVALQSIGKGEGILEIPANLIITPDTVRIGDWHTQGTSRMLTTTVQLRSKPTNI